MVASILVGLDSPQHRTDVTNLGIRWARQLGATLVGLVIVDEPGIRSLEPAWPVGGTPGIDPVIRVGYEEQLHRVEQRAEQHLEEFATRCNEAGVSHEEVKRVGSPDELIQKEAQAVDLVLLARHAHFRFTARADVGESTVRRVLQNIPRPVVVVPPSPHPDGPVVVAYDGSLQAARALMALEATGLSGPGPVNIISVEQLASEARHDAELAQRFLSYHKVESVLLVLESAAAPAGVILEQVGHLGASLLVMGAYGQPALREFVLGSVTATALSESPVPLFLYH